MHIKGEIIIISGYTQCCKRLQKLLNLKLTNDQYFGTPF